MDSTQISERPGFFTKPTTRRVACVMVPEERLFDLARAQVPADARVRAVEYSFVAGGFVVYLESETFPEVTEGTYPPQIATVRHGAGG